MESPEIHRAKPDMPEGSREPHNQSRRWYGYLQEEIDLTPRIQ